MAQHVEANATVARLEQVPSTEPATGALAARGAAARAVYWAGWLLPVVVAGRLLGFRVLDVTRGEDMLRGDWATYVAAPNFLRDAPLFAWPVGEIPNYLAPVGTSLGQTDSWPVLVPVYRVLLAIFPDSPIQLVGPLLFAGYIALFGVLRWHLRSVLDERAGGHLGVGAELTAIVWSGVLLAQPFFVERAGHVSLTHQWVIVLALIVAWRELRTGVRSPVPAAVALTVAASAAISPYLLAMVLPIAVTPALIRTRSDTSWATWGWWLALRAAGLSAIALGISVLLGYLGGGGRAGLAGFGLYPSNLLAPIDPGNVSRFFGDLPYAGSYEGYGYVGFAVLVVMGLAIWSRTQRRGGRVTGALAPLVIVCGLLALYALLPVVWLGNTEVLDASGLMSHFSDLTGTLRTHGRFIWPLLWLLGLTAVTVVIRRFSPTAALAIGGACLLVQVVEVPARATIEDNPAYAAVEDVMRDARAVGIERVEVHPPFVQYECVPSEQPTFAPLRNIALASAVVGLPINSGYAGRGHERLQQEVCQDQAEAFARGQFDASVLYIVPAAARSSVSALGCVRLPEDQLACADAATREWGA